MNNRIHSSPKLSVVVPVSYFPRGSGEGKKIGWRDGIEGVVATIRYNLFSPRSRIGEPVPTSPSQDATTEDLNPISFK
jgi:hypothetical protein